MYSASSLKERLIWLTLTLPSNITPPLRSIFRLISHWRASSSLAPTVTQGPTAQERWYTLACGR